MTPLRLVTVAGDINRETLLAEAFGYRSDVDLVLRCLDRVELLAAIRGADLAAIILVGDVGWFDRQSAHEAAERGIKVIGLSEEPSLPLVSRTVPADSSVDDVIAACLDTGLPTVGSLASPAQRRGRITAVWGPKGSPGRTRVAIELAHVLEDTGAGTLLMDADPYGGDVLQCLNIVDEIPSLIWASRMSAKGELDGPSMAANLRKVPGGPVVLPGLPRADLWPDVSEFGFAELLEICRESFAHTVADAGFCLEPPVSVLSEDGEGRNRIARKLVKESERVVAVCNGSPAGLKNFLWAFEDLRTILDPDRVVVVVNRTQAGTERELAQLLHRHIGKRPVSYIPDQVVLFDSALEHGTAAAKMRGGSEIRAAVEALAISLGAKLRPRGVLTRLAARR